MTGLLALPDELLSRVLAMACVTRRKAFCRRAKEVVWSDHYGVQLTLTQRAAEASDTRSAADRWDTRIRVAVARCDRWMISAFLAARAVPLAAAVAHALSIETAAASSVETRINVVVRAARAAAPFLDAFATFHTHVDALAAATCGDRDALAAAIAPHGNALDSVDSVDSVEVLLGTVAYVMGHEACVGLVEATTGHGLAAWMGHRPWLATSAAWHGDVARLRMLAARGALRVNTALTAVCGFGNVDAVDVVVSYARQRSELTTYAVKTAVFAAGVAGHVAVVDHLLDVCSDAAVDSAETLTQALLGACHGSKIRAVRRVLARGADPTVNDFQPLRVAAASGAAEVLRVLAAHVRRMPGDRSLDSVPLLYVAAKEGHDAAVATLLELGLDPCFPDDRPLRAAARKGRAGCVSLLLDYGADPRANDADPLRVAARKGFTDIVRDLLAHRGGRSARDQVAARDNEAIRMAAVNGHSEIVQTLARHGGAVWHVDAVECEGLGHVATAQTVRALQQEHMERERWRLRSCAQ